MKPLSQHWADQAANRIINQQGDKELYTLASGITPSGLVHVGNFREVITVDLVSRALEARGKQVRFVYSWDDFDTFRKVPKNIPNQEEFKPHLHKPISRIPDPWQKADSYSAGITQTFVEELKQLGIEPEYIYQEKQYANTIYAKEIRHALENVDTIKSILNKSRTTPLADNWLPTVIYCSKCQSDEMSYQKYLGDWDYGYKCASCGHEETIQINETKNLKLVWRVDWPMRWSFENVDFEPGGKDHSSRGGSYDTGCEIIEKLWGKKAPIYLQYDFVKIKGGSGKMSSSSGELLTLGEIGRIYEPQMIRWIFANQRPNHDFAISLDEDVIKVYDEFDRAEEKSWSIDSVTASSKDLLRLRVQQLSAVDKVKPYKQIKRPAFRLLCNRLQICGGNIERTFEKFYQKDYSNENLHSAFLARATRAMNWLKLYAPEEFKYHLHDKPVHIELSSEEHKALTSFRELIKDLEIENLDPKEINDLIWSKCLNQTSCEPKAFYKIIYQKLIGRDQGPRLPSFIKEIGQEKILSLLE